MDTAGELMLDDDSTEEDWAVEDLVADDNGGIDDLVVGVSDVSDLVAEDWDDDKIGVVDWDDVVLVVLVVVIEVEEKVTSEETFMLLIEMTSFGRLSSNASNLGSLCISALTYMSKGSRDSSPADKAI